MVKEHLVGFESVRDFGASAYDKRCEKRQSRRMSREKAERIEARFKKKLECISQNQITPPKETRTEGRRIILQKLMQVKDHQKRREMAKQYHRSLLDMHIIAANSSERKRIREEILANNRTALKFQIDKKNNRRA